MFPVYNTDYITALTVWQQDTTDHESLLFSFVVKYIDDSDELDEYLSLELLTEMYRVWDTNNHVQLSVKYVAIIV